MIPTEFPESNAAFGPPPDLTEQQCRTIKAHVGQVAGGSMDGAPFVVTAWKPTAEELAQLQQGGCVFLTCIGGLPPHFLSTSFTSATTVA